MLPVSIFVRINIDPEDKSPKFCFNSGARKIIN